MDWNPMLAVDSYKLDHRRQYGPGVTRVYSNWTPRGTRVEGQQEVVFLGLQYFLARYLMEGFQEFFALPAEEACYEYERRVTAHVGPNTIGSDHIRALHDLQYIPLRFCALPEGTRTPLRVPMLTVENTHPDFAWLTSYFESLMSNILWMPCTSATSAARMRDLLDRAALASGSPADFVGWQGHDFSFRGMPGIEAAALSGMGHLVFFEGTDTLPAVELVENYYPTLAADYMVGGSVPATEHSVMCAGTQTGELETFDRLLDLYPSGIVSVVSDTWDLWHVLTDILPKLHARIMGRDGKLVIRPDSGDPVAIICGDPSAPPDSPEHAGVVELLWREFGGTVTSTGHRLLDSHVGAIYGDGINYTRMQAILENLWRKGYASANMVFGVGSWNYQMVSRDTYGFAMKATWVEVDGVGRDIFKQPITDSGEKFSAKGRLAVVRGPDGQLTLINQATPEQEAMSELRLVWENGRFLRRDAFNAIRTRARGPQVG